ncbi:MAG: DUF6504 family protein [Chitinophagales bacterium]
MPEFIGRAVEVVTSGEPGGAPQAFFLDGRKVTVAQVLAAWQDYGFGATPPNARNWRTRRHRNCFRVSGDDGHTYELYLDRGAKTPRWHLYRRVD